jgi:flagellar hook-associated protein 3 FlgL
MKVLSQGDMAQTLLLRRQNSELKATLGRLAYEASSGRKSDTAAAVGGDFRVLASIEHSLTLAAAYRTAASEAATLAGSLQAAFGTIHTLAADLAPALNAAGTAGGATQVASVSQDARQKLFSTVSSLNLRIGDRYALSGDATDRKPILGAQEILDALGTAITGQPSATGAIGAIDAWFDAPAGGGGFLDTIYGGSATPLAPFRIAEGETSEMTITAADPTLRDMLKGLAIAAIVDEGALPGDLAGQALLLKTAGSRLMTSGQDLALLRADLGTTEQTIAEARTHSATEQSALEIARNRIVAADPYDTATELEAARVQLETLYALTARLSRLSLADYLR